MKNYLDIFRKQAKYLWLWMLRKDILIFLLFVGLTCIFWWGRTMSSPRDVVISIPVSYIGLGKQVVCEQTLPETLKVAIRDNGKQLRQINVNNLKLDYDIHSLVSEKEGVLTLSTEQLRPKMQDLLPGTTLIQNISPESFTSKYYIQEQKVVPIRLVSDIQVATQHQMVGAPIITPDSIQIFGTKRMLDTIHEIPTQKVIVNQLRDHLELQTGLILPNGITANQNEIGIQVLAEQFTEKSMSVPIRVKGVPEGVKVRLFPQSVELIARVGIANFSNISASDIEVYCEYSDTISDALEVKIKNNNPHITNLRISPDKVEYIINQ